METASHEQLVGDAVVAVRGEVETVVLASLLGKMVVASLVECLYLGTAAAGRLEQAHTGRVVGGEELLQGGLDLHLGEVGRNPLGQCG